MSSMRILSSQVVLVACCVAFIPLQPSAQEAAPAKAEKPYLQAAPGDMQWWREARFGLFVHWGPVSLKGTEIGWSRGGERRGLKGKGPIPVEVYDNLYKEFNPVDFDAKEWIAMAKAAGMKYLVFTSKHHDGFSMFDSKLTGYTIMHSPFGRDVVAELAEACHEAGFGLGFYYSPPDWHHPDYRTENHARYIEFLHGQLRELCTNYGRVDIIWFDGLGGTAQDWDSEKLFKMIRELQPHVIINNRAGLPGDLDTPEQTIGRFQRDRSWESCITICRQWAWKPEDTLKGLKECIDTLVRCAGGDGNLLLNVGPMPTGAIEPRQVARLEEIGAWMKQYGGAIYATRGGPFRPGNWGASTCKGNTVYLHLLAAPKDSIVLPPLPRKILAATVLTGGNAEVTQTETGITVSVPPQHHDALDTIVALELDGPVEDIEFPKFLSGSLAQGKAAKASNIYQNMPLHGPDKAFDGDPDTRWATDYGVHEVWLEVDLGEAVAIGRAVLSEAYGRVRAFQLQYKDAGAWRPFAEGTTIGDLLTLDFEPVTARHIRLDIRKATEGPTIWEFQLFPSKP